MTEDTNPRLPKIPFIVANVVLVCIATVIAFSGEGRPQGFEALCVVLCAALGGAIGFFPFYAEFKALVRLQEFSQGQDFEERYRQMETALIGLRDHLEHLSSTHDEGRKQVQKMQETLHLFESRVQLLEEGRADIEAKLAVGLKKGETASGFKEKWQMAIDKTNKRVDESDERLRHLENASILLEETLGRLKADAPESTSDQDLEPPKEMDIEDFRTELSKMQDEMEKRESQAPFPKAVPAEKLEEAPVEEPVAESEPVVAFENKEPVEFPAEEVAEPTVEFEIEDTLEAEAAEEPSEMESSEPEPSSDPLEDALEEPVEETIEEEPEESVEWGEELGADLTEEAEPVAEETDVPVALEDTAEFDSGTSEEASNEETELLSEPEVAEEPEQTEPEQEEPKAAQAKPVEQPDLLTDIPKTPRRKSKRASKKKSQEASTLIAQVLIGIGNKPYVRGEGAGLSQEKGVPMEFLEIGKWQWTAPDSSDPVTCYIYKNDEVMAEGEPIVLEPGQRRAVSPKFPA